MATLEERIQRLEDIRECEQLQYKYEHYLDIGYDGDGIASLFVPDGLWEIRGCGGTASDELCLLVVLNTASIQLLPATIASVRSASGAQSPFDILPAVWLASALSVTVGILTAKFLAAAGRCRR